MYPMRVSALLLALIGLALFSVTRVIEAQAPLRRIALLSGDVTCAANDGLRALLEELRSLGYRDRENVMIDCRSAEGRYDRLDALAAELVQLNPAVFVAASAPSSLAAKRATASIPIVSVYTADPVGLGLVASLAQPGSNVTGISALATDHVAKSLQILKEAATRTSRVGVLGHSANPTYAIYRRELEPAGRAMGIALDFVPVVVPEDIEPALSAMQLRGVNAFLVMHQPFTFVHRERIVRLVARLRLPAMYGSREAVELGGLISYAVSVSDTFRRGAHLVDKILRGSKPGELPVEQPTKFELIVNLKAARAVGLTVPASLLLRADQVIE